MKKLDILPVIAAVIIALLVVPTGAFAALPATPAGLASVVTIPEDNAKMNMGVMVLGLTPVVNDLGADGNWYDNSMCSGTALTDVVVGPELTLEPIVWPITTVVTYYQLTNHGQGGWLCVAHQFAPAWGASLYGRGLDLLSQHKMLATLNGVPTKPDYFLCEIVEKEKAKVPPQTTKSLGLRQFPDEIIGTTLRDVSSNFVCKYKWIKPGVGALDVYFVGPHVAKFIADHMLIITVGYKVGKSTVWASDLQDICILGWAMDPLVLQILLFSKVTLSSFGPQNEYYFSWPSPLGPFDSCDEAAAWQLAWLTGGWPYATAGTGWPTTMP